MSIAIQTQTTAAFEASLSAAIEDAFPVITGVPGSWADIMDFVDAFRADKIQGCPKRMEPPLVPHPISTPSSKTLRNRRKREKVKARKLATKKKEEEEWTEVQKVRKPKVQIPAYTRSTMPKRVFKKVYNSQESTLVLKGLPYHNTSVLDLMKIFEVHGFIENINILKNKDGSCKGIAFVRFEAKESADKAVGALSRFWYIYRWVRTARANNR